LAGAAEAGEVVLEEGEADLLRLAAPAAAQGLCSGGLWCGLFDAALACSLACAGLCDSTWAELPAAAETEGLATLRGL
jgi:hypothetical protein